MYGLCSNLYTVRYVYNCHMLWHAMYACTKTIKKTNSIIAIAAGKLFINHTVKHPGHECFF